MVASMSLQSPALTEKPSPSWSTLGSFCIDSPASGEVGSPVTRPRPLPGPHPTTNASAATKPIRMLLPPTSRLSRRRRRDQLGIILGEDGPWGQPTGGLAPPARKTYASSATAAATRTPTRIHAPNDRLVGGASGVRRESSSGGTSGHF